MQQLLDPGDVASPRLASPAARARGRKTWQVVFFSLLLTTLTLQGLLLWLQKIKSTTSASQHHCLTQGLGPASSVRLFVGVLSRSNHTAVRQAIRETWGSDPRLARLMFVVLRPASAAAFRALREEAAAQQDLIVVSGTQEGYYSITYSTLELFRMAAVLAPQLTHVLKTDDDCLVRVGPLLDALAAAPQHGLYAGGEWGLREFPSRNASDHTRHYVPWHNWPSAAPLPPYAYGLGVVLSIDLVTHIAAGAAHLTMPPDNLLMLEDVSTGVWVDWVCSEQATNISYMRLPFNSTACRPTDALTHLGGNKTHKTRWPSLADAHRCLFTGACADECVERDPSPRQQLVTPVPLPAAVSVEACRHAGAAAGPSNSSSSTRELLWGSGLPS